MSTQAATVERANTLSGDQSSSREGWLIARRDLVNRAKELARLCDQLGAERDASAWAKIDKKCAVAATSDDAMLAELASGRSSFTKQSGYRFVGFVGPLIVAVYLFLQLQKLPNSSLSYSLLYAIISLLFNFSSSALLKIF